MKKILALCLMLLGLSSSLYANPFTSVMGKVFSKSITKSAPKTVGKQAGKLAVKQPMAMTFMINTLTSARLWPKALKKNLNHKSI